MAQSPTMISHESNSRIFLSPPHMGSEEKELLIDAFDSNWIAPLGPHVDAFEQELAAAVGSSYAAALSSGTAAIHLALRLLNIQSGDEVLCSSLTFSASANPILYEKATPVFVDSEATSWNIDPARLEEAVIDRIRKCGRPPKALIAVHLYGQSAHIDALMDICHRYDIQLIEDAAEALGATYTSVAHAPSATTKAPGSYGTMGIYSFNGNKIITTSGGGMLVSDNKDLIQRARFLASQARDPAPHYQHSQVGYNYRLSNLLAAVGRGQLRNLQHRVDARRAIFDRYKERLQTLPGVHFMPEAPWNKSTRWLTCLTIDPMQANTDRETIRLALESANIEARPVWKPLHLQPIFADYPMYGGSVSERLFQEGLCLPSGSALTCAEQDRVCSVIERCFQR